VVEEIYAGPQGALVPEGIRALCCVQHAIAELGFIVVQIDGMGTSQPPAVKAFHDVLLEEPRRSGFPGPEEPGCEPLRRVSPWMDLTRVGLYGRKRRRTERAPGTAGSPASFSFRGRGRLADATTTGWTRSGGTSSGSDGPWMKRYKEIVQRGRRRQTAGKAAADRPGEVDTDVDPASTMQVVNALEKAGKISTSW
jgi:hypothetical protein